jgi:hypothetical protein
VPYFSGADLEVLDLFLVLVLVPVPVLVLVLLSQILLFPIRVVVLFSVFVVSSLLLPPFLPQRRLIPHLVHLCPFHLPPLLPLPEDL